MNFVCPACRTPLPVATPAPVVGVVACTHCALQVDVTRADTAPGVARVWPEVDLSGESLGPYLLTRRIGSGGMGTVYESTCDGRAVAVKVLASSLAADPSLRDRFRREARSLAAVNHPRVVRLLDEGEARGFTYFAMELVQGEDLRARLQRGPLSVEEVVALARQALEGLEAIHAAGVVHRDVKPANVLLGERGAQWCDFGIARLDGSATLTESSALLGSLKYLAPEARWGRAETRSDVYGLGVVLQEALAGGVPGEQPLPSATPRWLRRFIEELTHAAAARRPATATVARQRLETLRRGPARLASAVLAGALALAVGVVASMNSASSPAVEPALPLLMVTLRFDSVPSAVFFDGQPVLATAEQVLQTTAAAHHVVYDCSGVVGLEDPLMTVSSNGEVFRFRGCAAPNDNRVDGTEKALTEARMQLGQEVGLIKVESIINGQVVAAQVLIDGLRPQETAASMFVVGFGSHVVTARFSGGQTERKVQVSAAQPVVELRLELPPDSPVPANALAVKKPLPVALVDEGTVFIDATLEGQSVPAEVLLGGKKVLVAVGKKRLGYRLPLGRHSLLIRYQGASVVRTVELSAAQSEVDLLVELSSPAPKKQAVRAAVEVLTLRGGQMVTASVFDTNGRELGLALGAKRPLVLPFGIHQLTMRYESFEETREVEFTEAEPTARIRIDWPASGGKPVGSKKKSRK